MTVTDIVLVEIVVEIIAGVLGVKDLVLGDTVLSRLILSDHLLGQGLDPMGLGSLLFDFIILNQSFIIASIEHLLLLSVHFLPTGILFLLPRVYLLELGLVAEEHLGWMTLAYDVQGLFNIF